MFAFLAHYLHFFSERSYLIFHLFHISYLVFLVQIYGRLIKEESTSETNDV